MISLFRIDDRLIHGQVIVGWGVTLKPDHYVIIDDDLEEWEAELYLGCLEDESQGEIVTTEEAVNRYSEWKENSEHVVILIKDPLILKKLSDIGFELAEINLGGLHYLQGKKQFLNCLYLNEEEHQTLKCLVEKFKITYQPLPCDCKVDLKTVL